MSFTLIVATIGRTTELETLFESLALQHIPGLDCIVVDQNADDRLRPIVDRWQKALSIRIFRSSPGLSRSRNIGLQYATGDIVAFPDDDCWYSPSLLEQVAQWFEKHSEFNILTVGAKDHDGIPSGNRWIHDQCEIRPVNAFRTTFSSTIFVRRSAAFLAVRFDESLGVGSGTHYSCGEETDYILNLIGRGERGFFDRAMYVGHPKRDMLSGQVDRRRAADYGHGMGHVLRKHSLGLLWTAFVAYDLLRSALVAVKGDFTGAALCVFHGWGITTGFLESAVLEK